MQYREQVDQNENDILEVRGETIVAGVADALPKLRGLADFAVAYSDCFHRIEAVARMQDGKLRVLDLTDKSVRNAVEAASDAKSLYQSSSAEDYSAN